MKIKKGRLRFFLKSADKKEINWVDKEKPAT